MHDFNIVNFEFPIVLKKGYPIEKGGPSLSGQKKAIDAIKYAGFNVCTLANNHILDQGEQCCLDTKNNLESVGMNTVGVGQNLNEAKRILYLRTRNETIAIINCCETEFSIATLTTTGANPLNPIQQFYKINEAKQNADFVLVIVHGGHEYCQLPSPRMKELYHFFVDIGADAVVNHHQHCYSGYEIYNNKPIFYGIGNFLFDWKGKQNCSWNEGYMVSFNFSKNQDVSFELYPFTQCNEKPNVKPMENEAYRQFNLKILDLNTILTNDNLLLKEWEHWILENSTYFQLDFQPYNNRILKALFIRGLLPSFMTKKKKYSILNHITCESHLDRMRYIIKNINNNI